MSNAALRRAAFGVNAVGRWVVRQMLRCLALGVGSNGVCVGGNAYVGAVGVVGVVGGADAFAGNASAAHVVVAGGRRRWRRQRLQCNAAAMQCNASASAMLGVKCNTMYGRNDESGDDGVGGAMLSMTMVQMSM